MKPGKIIVIISLVTIAMIGLVIIQIRWLKMGMESQEVQLRKETGKIQDFVTDNINSNTHLKKTLLKIIYSDLNNDTFVTPDDITLINNSLDKLYKKATELYSIKTKYKYIVFNQNKKIILGNSNEEYISGQMNVFHHCLGEIIHNQDRLLHDDYSVGIYFPNETTYLLGKVKSLLIALVLFVTILIICFVYITYTVIKQKKLSDIKNDFINNLTHELKTPIFSISLLTKVFKENLNNYSFDKYFNYLELIDNENKRLSKHVENVLQIALLDNKKLNMRFEETDFHKLIKKVISVYDIIAKNRNGKIIQNLNSKSHLIHIDKTHISNLIHNLVDNALKYSKDKPVINIQTEDSFKGINFIIKDNGVGIKKSEQKKLFDKFYRVPTGNLHKVKGFGLGLSYVKMVVETHKGNISLNSKIEEGTEFKIYLPHNQH